MMSILFSQASGRVDMLNIIDGMHLIKFYFHSILNWWEWQDHVGGFKIDGIYSTQTNRIGLSTRYWWSITKFIIQLIWNIPNDQYANGLWKEIHIVMPGNSFLNLIEHQAMYKKVWEKNLVEFFSTCSSK